jgi:hypothetical protein
MEVFYSLSRKKGFDPYVEMPHNLYHRDMEALEKKRL